MRDPSVAEPAYVTTGDAARMLQITAEGVRWLARQRRLVGERAPSGQWFFRVADVEVVAKRRAKVRGGLVIVPPPTGVRGEPRQLELFVGWEDVERKVTLRSRSEEIAIAQETRRESDNGPDVNLRAAKARR